MGITSSSRSIHSPFALHMVLNRVVKCKKTGVLNYWEENTGFKKSRARFTIGSSCFMLFQWWKASVNPTCLAWSHQNFYHLLQKWVNSFSAQNLVWEQWCKSSSSWWKKPAHVTMEKTLCSSVCVDALPQLCPCPHVSAVWDLWERSSLLITALQTPEQWRELAIPLQWQQSERQKVFNQK